MSEPYLGQISMFSFPFAPMGWAACDGAILPINQNQALFSFIGTTYGGDGKTTFALPDLRGRVPVHFGKGVGMEQGVAMGQAGGEEVHVLTTAEIPSHSHTASGSSAPADQKVAAGMVWASSASNPYAPQPNMNMSAQAIAQAGTNVAHENRQPYLPINFCIALTGIYPSRT